ncbi:hypothetical protein PAPYR_1483 [Paratrimastix pyriformis]|uniref:S1-like domain-containing protein n=1 Tax=Paratrimastix pyriformis TaxID=342808 RepID=A0ABQ8URR8_9EUKA|nr:hypothetical protein PAPYR_1483 [Paratrimastix pyriformis]
MEIGRVKARHFPELQPPAKRSVSTTRFRNWIFLLVSFRTNIMLRSNKTGGSGQRKKAHKGQPDNRELQMREEGQEYGRVTQVLGSGRFRVVGCGAGRPSEPPLLCKLRGAIHRRGRIGLGDVVLFSKRDYDLAKGDIILGYSSEDAHKLEQYGAIQSASSLTPGDAIGDSQENNDIVFSVDAL